MGPPSSQPHGFPMARVTFITNYVGANYVAKERIWRRGPHQHYFHGYRG